MPAEWTPHERTFMAWPARAELWGAQLAQAKATGPDQFLRLITNVVEKQQERERARRARRHP